MWQHELEASASPDRQAFQLVVDHGTGAVAVVAGDELSYLDAAGKSLWQTDSHPYRQIWMSADGAVEAVDRRISNTGELLDTYSTGLGYRAGSDSQGNVIALSDALVKLDADRNELFRRQLIGELGTPRAQEVAIDPHDEIVVAWAGSRVCDTAFVLRKFTAEGEPRWTQCPNLRQATGRVPMAIDTDGDILLAGEAPPDVPMPHDGSPQNWVLKRYDADGNERWTRPIAKLITSRDGAHDDVDNALAGLAIDRQHNILIVGRVLGRSVAISEDVFVMKLDAEAREHWRLVRTSTAGEDDRGVAIATDGDDNVLVLGRMNDSIPRNVSPTASAARTWIGKLAR
jgi:hypothetical protein